jgi:hypothetical protein
MQFEGEYFGGNFNLRADRALQKTNILLKINDCVIDVCPSSAPLTRQYLSKPALSISYGDIVKIENLPSERMSAVRYFFVGTGAFALRKKEFFLNVSFRDSIGMEQNIVFKMKQADECYKAVYDRIAKVRGKK